ncbi:MAG: hypothetical protein IT355_15355 [Gemmatimonadaceae bacterium]|nr:hypothetical protein [Gemmatimonadaceae bacterium]
MRQRRQILLLSGTLSALGACTNAVAPPAPAAVTVTVTVRAASVDPVVTAAGSVTWVRFTLPLRFENTGATSVSVEPCASYIESRSGGTWRSAWMPVCATGGASLRDILPGEIRDAEIQVAAALAGPGAPRWDAASLDVPLRYQAGYVWHGVSGRIPTVASNEFTLGSSR